ncbi:unnamed protein product [Oreochromis niloticus]|nr:unnamed protein product [Mustela putorius furo]
MLLILIIFSLTGCEAESEVRACHHRWAQITCKYPKTNNTYQYIDVVLSNETTVQSSKKDVWENKGRLCLYHDTKNKNLKVAIKHVKEREFGEYRCIFFQRPNSSDIQEGKLENELENCPRTFLSVYRTANTTITCDYPDVYEPHIKFFCKKNHFHCDDILSTKSSPKSKGTFTLTGSSRAFNISISDVTSQDAGDYWCGVESNDGSYRFSHTHVHLKVIDIKTLTPTIGHNFTYQCKYNQDASSLTKFICKGEDSTVCKQLVTTTEPDVEQRFIMKEHSGSITITVREVTANDSGIYWCGARHKHNQTHDDFFDGFNLSFSLTQGSIPHLHEHENFVFVLIVCIAFLLLMVVTVLILIYKRLSPLKDTGSEATTQNIKEDNIYEEIEQHFQSPGSENATNTVYLTVDHPTNHPASLHYSTIIFPSSSDIAAAETLILTPSSSACKYSTVKHSRSLTTSTATHPPRPPQEPLYSKVNKLKPKQK